MMKASVPLLQARRTSRSARWMPPTGAPRRSFWSTAGFQKAPVDIGQGLHRRISQMNAIALDRPTGRRDRSPSQPEPLIAIEGLRFASAMWSPSTSLSLTVRRGEFVSLLGPSGCGKSTLLKAIAGLVPPTGGRIAHARPQCCAVGFMFQKPLLLPWRTTLDNVAAAGRDSAWRQRGRFDRSTARAAACWRWLGSAISPTPIRTSYPAGCSNARRWRAR